jgi:hypothetical protein
MGSKKSQSLSAAPVPAGRDERKSKDPEDVSSAIQLQGVLLKAASSTSACQQQR